MKPFLFLKACWEVFVEDWRVERRINELGFVKAMEEDDLPQEAEVSTPYHP